ncbi:unnamed protein product [Zymoseptoria tritici ST99CH_1E4]|uniref:Uncharacterized protein n=1 Tax=Zymoseptoria tritici ST99CH_1E4 TaxID=1276532 RepID=A0A2H1H951_ZYMTR|nr:unnamed protein product [Zymoseptoria tritici ST99CH_1E4]
MPPELDFLPVHHPSSQPCSTPPPLSPLMAENPFLNHVEAAFHLSENAVAPRRASKSQAKAEVRVSEYGIADDRTRTSIMTAGMRERGLLFNHRRENAFAGSSNVVGEGDGGDSRDWGASSCFSSSSSSGDDDGDAKDAETNFDTDTNGHDSRDLSDEREYLHQPDLSGDDVQVDPQIRDLHPRYRDIDLLHDRPARRISTLSTSVPSRHRQDPTPYPSRATVRTLPDGQCDIP